MRTGSPSHGSRHEGGISEWGNSLALRVPKVVAQEIGASDGKTAEMSVRDGKLVIEVTKPKRRKRRYTLDELVAGITPENRHEEIDWATSGNEATIAQTPAIDLDRSQPDRRPRTERPSSGIGADIEEDNATSGLCVACPITSRVVAILSRSPCQMMVPFTV